MKKKSNKIKTRVRIIIPLSLIVFLVAESVVVAQDRHFSQIDHTPLILNPANSGLFDGSFRGSIHYRNQWASVTSPYTTIAANFDSQLMKQKIRTGFLGIGILFYKDAAGDANLGTTKFDVSISYNLKINEQNKVSAGVQGGFSQRTLNPTNLKFDNQYDGIGYNPSLPSKETRESQSVSNFDTGAGLRWTYLAPKSSKINNKGVIINAGAAIYHINSSNISFNKVVHDKLFSRITLHGDAFVGVKNTHLAFIPSFLVQQQGKINETIVGTHLRYRVIEGSKYTGLVNSTFLSIGLHTRMKDAMIISAAFEHNYYLVSFSYDVNISELSKASNSIGGLEITLKFTNPNSLKGKSSGKFKSFL